MKIDGGRIKLDEWMLMENDYPIDDELGGHHHMGGTRMHKSNTLGVVDANCKVFGSNPPPPADPLEAAVNLPC